jgi:predicted RNA-binding Zn-ribbon protein involved in translation (DUF1610 family)
MNNPPIDFLLIAILLADLMLCIAGFVLLLKRGVHPAAAFLAAFVVFSLSFVLSGRIPLGIWTLPLTFVVIGLFFPKLGNSTKSQAKTCINCGRHVSVHTIVCPTCKSRKFSRDEESKLSSHLKECPDCGREVAITTKSCPSCDCRL